MNFITLLAPIFGTLIERLFPDKAKQDEAKIAMQQALNEAQIEADKAQAIRDTAKAGIITAEINAGGWASNWRAYLMMVCIAIVGYNWIVVSLLNAFLTHWGAPIHAVDVPTELWTLITIGLGGYIGKETMTNYTQAKYGPVNDAKFFDVLRAKVFKSGMTQEQVAALEEALKVRDNAQ